MYSNMGPWVIEPAYTGDEEWIDIWPNEGDDSGRFTVTVSANEGAYTRYSSVNVVIGGKVVKSFEVAQSGTEPSIALDMGSDHITAASKGGTITVPLKANIGWKPLTLESAAGWITFGDADPGDAQELIVSPNTATNARRGPLPSHRHQSGETLRRPDDRAVQHGAGPQQRGKA